MNFQSILIFRTHCCLTSYFNSIFFVFSTQHIIFDLPPFSMYNQSFLNIYSSGKPPHLLGGITRWGDSNWVVNVIYRVTTLPKNLNAGFGSNYVILTTHSSQYYPMWDFTTQLTTLFTREYSNTTKINSRISLFVSFWDGHFVMLNLNNQYFEWETQITYLQ